MRQSEVTFIYILATSPLGEPDGTVRSDAGVIEIGNGADPVGPPEGVSTSFFDLSSQMVRLLS
jgi:hypothetical protein